MRCYRDDDEAGMSSSQSVGSSKSDSCPQLHSQYLQRHHLQKRQGNYATAATLKAHCTELCSLLSSGGHKGCSAVGLSAFGAPFNIISNRLCKIPIAS